MSKRTITLCGLLLCRFIHCLAACTVPSVPCDVLTPTWVGSSTCCILLRNLLKCDFPSEPAESGSDRDGPQGTRRFPQRHERGPTNPRDDRRGNMAVQEKLCNLRQKAQELIPGGQPHSLLEVARAGPEAPAPEVGEKSDTALRIMSGVTHGAAAGPMSRRFA